MVCRENKGRSANIGIMKALHYATTGERIHDSELQSMQHQLRHEVEATEAFEKYQNFDAWPKEDQIAAWRDMLSHIDSIPDDVMSPADKYRNSHKQPGAATRIKQEIARLEKGTHEGTGKALTKDQLNSGADMLATMRMLDTLKRNTPARKNFLESNARRRGLTYQQAENEWNQLMNRSGDFSNIRLTDDFRDSMSVAGVDAQDQANLGQSGRARSAMQVMEQRAQDHLKSLDSDKRRPGLRPEHARGTWVKPDDPKAKLKCGKCGQFGHDDAACPNGEHLATLEECDDLDKRLDKHQAIHVRKNIEAEHTDDEIQTMLSEAGSDLTVDEWKGMIAKEEEALGEPLLPSDTMLKLRIQADKERTAAEAAIDDSGVKVSGWIKSVSYNPDNGLLAVEQHPYTKKDGSVSVYPPRYFRARPEQVDALLQDESIGKAVHQHLLDSNKTKDMHQFENAADLQAAMSEVRCPNCGQWASMNSNHRCPVPGGPSEEFDVERRRRQMDYRALARSARAEGSTPPEPPMAAVQAMHYSELDAHLPDPEVPGNKFHGHLKAGTKKNALEQMEQGKLFTSSVNFTGLDEDCHVTGEVSAWRDSSGIQMMSIYPAGGSRGLQCTCAQYQAHGMCKHVRSVAGTLKQRFEANAVTRGTKPGASYASVKQRRSEDGSTMAPTRLGYEEIAERRKSATNEYAWEHINRRKANKVPGLWVHGKPTDQNGEPVEQPTVWERDPEMTAKPGNPVNLTDVRAVRARLRSLAQSKGGRGKRVPYSVTLDPDKSGAILINIPPSSMKSGKESTARMQRRKLAKLMGVSEKAITARGYRVSPNGAARHNALDRMAGDPPRITPATVSYQPTDSELRGSQQRHRSGNDGAFVG